MNIAYYLPFTPDDGYNKIHQTDGLKIASAQRQDNPAMTGHLRFPPATKPGDSFEQLDGLTLYHFLCQTQHQLRVASNLNNRWLYLKPWHYGHLAQERRNTQRDLSTTRHDVWINCHGNETAPDMLGPYCCRRLSIPYVCYQPTTGVPVHRIPWVLPGLVLHRAAMKSAALVITASLSDATALRRVLPKCRVQHLLPHLQPEQFSFDLVARRALRDRWSVGERRVIMTTAMFRPGANTIGIRKIIDSCVTLRTRGLDILLVIAGDGLDRSTLEREGHEKLRDNILFLGKVPRLELYRYYSAADVFAFPGIQDSRGISFLEAQSAGLPVVAFSDWGAAELVVHEITGLLAPASKPELFSDYLECILANRDRRISMREAAKMHIRNHHDLTARCRFIQRTLQEIVSRYRTTV